MDAKYCIHCNECLFQIFVELLIEKRTVCKYFPILRNGEIDLKTNSITLLSILLIHEIFIYLMYIYVLMSIYKKNEQHCFFVNFVYI